MNAMVTVHGYHGNHYSNLLLSPPDKVLEFPNPPSVDNYAYHEFINESGYHLNVSLAFWFYHTINKKFV